MTYSELKTAIVAYMKRADLASQLDTFIDLFEARASRKLRHPRMETTETVTPVADAQALPTGWQEFRSVQYNGSGYTHILEYASPQKISVIGLASGDPQFYSIRGGEVVFSPSAIGDQIEWTFYQSIPALSDTNQTNWLLDNYPDYYLMGCVHQACIYTLDDRAFAIEQHLVVHESSINKAVNKAAGPITIIAG